MSNMSYCRFENTYNDLRDCVGVMEDAVDLPELDLSESEKDAMFGMKRTCEMFLESFARLKAATTVEDVREPG